MVPTLAMVNRLRGALKLSPAGLAAERHNVDSAKIIFDVGCGKGKKEMAPLELTIPIGTGRYYSRLGPIPVSI